MLNIKMNGKELNDQTYCSCAEFPAEKKLSGKYTELIVAFKKFNLSSESLKYGSLHQE